MVCRRYLLYMTWNKKSYRVGISANPQIDLSYLYSTEHYEYMAFISPPLPLALCEYLMNLISTAEERVGKSYRSLKYRFWKRNDGSPRSILIAKFRQVKKELANYDEDFPAAEPVVFDYNSGVNIDYVSLHQFEDIVEAAVQGRIQSIGEIHRRIKQGIRTEVLEDTLHLLTLKGMVSRVPSVKYAANGVMACNRCGHQYTVAKVFCTTGQKDCYYCQECLMLGGSKPCEALYAAPAKTRPEERTVSSIRLNLDISFSLAQYEAFEGLTRFVRKDSVAECLVWEATGAGRPETVFGAVREVLKRGGRVLFGVPRKDVLVDLVERLEMAFPGVGVAVRYGKMKPFPLTEEIVLASTHQALKYYRSFELVILDESDAFPFRANPILINALRRAKKVDGKLIYMTPTPAPDIYSRAQRGEIKVIQIPSRTHGHPMAIPQALIEKEFHQDRVFNRMLALIRESIEEDQAQVLVVVPDSEMLARVESWLSEHGDILGVQGFRERAFAFTGGHDPQQERKIFSFIRNETSVIVTTGLTVRGDLAPHSNMIVLGCDNDLFDEGYLLQLAGRVGWSEDYPTGRVWFIGSRMTRAMDGAIRKIRLLNDEAQKKGYLDQAKKKYHQVLR